jgi:hypothetical protein
VGDETFRCYRDLLGNIKMKRPLEILVENVRVKLKLNFNTCFSRV